MSLSITQNPSSVALAQSPTAFSVFESNAELRASSSFQYLSELYYWTGSLTESGSTSQYTLTKFPNKVGVGIFDVSRVLSSTFQTLRAADSSSVQFYAIDTYVQYQSGSQFYTGSHVRSDTFKAVDGYDLFQSQVNEELTSSATYFPMMTDGPQSQSVLPGNYGRMSVWIGPETDVSHYIISASDFPGEDQSTALPTTSNNTSGSIVTIPMTVNEPDWPITTSTKDYQIFLITGSNYNGSNQIGATQFFEEKCPSKYDNVRIKWKNRFGQFDYFNFNLVSTETFNTKRSKYQPQIGSWDGGTLSYQDYETTIQNYIIDSTLNLSVNTDYVKEEYNDIFKQLISSDEIYWVYDEPNDKVRPLAINTTRFNVKTEKVDKLIQYSFNFTQGQGYKLIF